MNQTKLTPKRRYGGNPFQRAASWRAVALHRAALGRHRRIPEFARRSRSGARAGPTQEHLVEEIAGIFWRKRRLRLAEAAAYRRGLHGTFTAYRETVKVAVAHLGGADQPGHVGDAISANESEAEEEIRDMASDEAMTRRALDLLDSERQDAYEAALKELRDDTREWWAAMLAGDVDDELEEDEVTADVEGLRRFIEDKVLARFERRRRQIASRPLIREQAFGEALDPKKLEPLGRYEVHLDRKLERMLTMLLRLKELHQGTGPTRSVWQKHGGREEPIPEPAQD